MKFIYPAVFRKTDDGRYKGTFPDLEDCYGEGDTLDEAIENANAAAFDWITLELSEEVPELPAIILLPLILSIVHFLFLPPYTRYTSESALNSLPLPAFS